jgi:hypothetical protein
MLYPSSFILYPPTTYTISLSRIVGIGDKRDERVEKKKKKKKKPKKKLKKKEKCNDVPEYDDDSEDLPAIDWGIAEPPYFKPFRPHHDAKREDLAALATIAIDAIEACRRARHKFDYLISCQRDAISAYQEAAKGPADID